MFYEAPRGFMPNEEFSHNNTRHSGPWRRKVLCGGPNVLHAIWFWWKSHPVEALPPHWYCPCVRFPVSAALQWKMTVTFSPNSQSGLRCTFPCVTLIVHGIRPTRTLSRVPQAKESGAANRPCRAGGSGGGGIKLKKIKKLSLHSMHFRFFCLIFTWVAIFLGSRKPVGTAARVNGAMFPSRGISRAYPHCVWRATYPR